MRRYLLDTSLLAAYLFGRLHAVELITPWITRREVATSILVYGEVLEHLKSKLGYPRGDPSLIAGQPDSPEPGSLRAAGLGSGLVGPEDGVGVVHEALV